MLTGVFQLSRRQAMMAVADFFAVDISLGAVSTLEDRVSDAIAQRSWADLVAF